MLLKVCIWILVMCWVVVLVVKCRFGLCCVSVWLRFCSVVRVICCVIIKVIGCLEFLFGVGFFCLIRFCLLWLFWCWFWLG